jgi:hypothetical protein
MIYLNQLYNIFLPLGIPKVLIKLIFDFMPKWICKKNKDKIILSNDFFNIFDDDILVWWEKYGCMYKPDFIKTDILNDSVYYLMYLISRGHQFCDCIYPVQDHTKKSRFWFTDDNKFENHKCQNFLSKYTNYWEWETKQREEYCSCVGKSGWFLYHMCPCHYLYYTCDINQKYVSSTLIEHDDGPYILLDNIPKIKQFFSVPNNKLMVLKEK